MDGVIKELEDFKDSFLESEPMKKSVEENWNQLTKAIFDAMDNHIPQKKLSSWQHVPWMSSTIKRMIRKKKRLWNRAKRSRLEKDWEKFRQIRKTVKAKMKTSHEEYVMGILENSLKERPKKFWSYISSLKKDVNGIPTLKTEMDQRLTARQRQKLWTTNTSQCSPRRILPRF